MPPGAVELSYLEKKVLLALGKLQKASPEELRAAGKFRELVEVMNAASWLQAKGLVTMKERVVHSYRLARPEVARRQLPERKALKAAIKEGGRIEVAGRRLPAVRHEGVRAPDPAGEAARPRGLHRADPADLPEHGLHGNPRRLRPVGVLELRCPLSAARPSRAGPARHVLSVQTGEDAPPRR